jgi:4-amino-4-deoxy-L-arabinose transferase-like glycosyltransferase
MDASARELAPAWPRRLGQAGGLGIWVRPVRETESTSAEPTARRRLLAILTVAFALRLVLLVPAHDMVPRLDSLDYVLIANRIANQGDYGSWGRAPGYPLLLAGTFRVARGLDLSKADRRRNTTGLTGLDVARFVQVLLSTLAVWLAFALGRRLYDARAGLAAAALMALYPNFVGQSQLLWAETLYITLTLAWALLVHRGVVDGRRLALVGAGLCLGYAALVREVGVPTIGVAVLWMWLLARGPRRRTLAQIAVVVAMAALVILPWTIRNYRVHGELVLSSSSQGLALLWGSSDHVMAELRAIKEAAGIGPRHPVFCAEVDRLASARARAIIAADPAAWLRRIWTRNLPSLWHPGFDGVIAHVVRPLGFDVRSVWVKKAVIVLVVGSYLLLGTLAIFGLAASRSREATWLVLALVLLYGAMHAIATGVPRHRLPLMALATLPAGYLLSRQRVELRSLLGAGRLLVALAGVTLFLWTVSRNDDRLGKAWTLAEAGPAKLSQRAAPGVPVTPSRPPPDCAP